MPDDKHAEFQGYSNELTGDDPNNTSKLTEKDMKMIDKGGKDSLGQELDPLAIIGITNMTVSEAESQFTQAELTQIKKEFNKNSKD